VINNNSLFIIGVRFHVVARGCLSVSSCLPLVAGAMDSVLDPVFESTDSGVNTR